MMNESETIREFPRAVRFPVAVWFQGVFVGQLPAVKPLELKRRIGTGEINSIHRQSGGIECFNGVVKDKRVSVTFYECRPTHSLSY